MLGKPNKRGETMPSVQSIAPLVRQASDLSVFHHHIYEYKKGIRSLILTTEKSIYREPITERLTREKIDFAIQDVNKDKINVFFGAKNCIEVIKTFIHKKLNELSAEQDFILGVLLGYDKVKQCDRYLDIIEKQTLKLKKKA
jgi:hypothetical protein